MLRSLWNCQNVRYPDGVKHKAYIWCNKGHKLGNGQVPKGDADNQKPLEYRVCQLCKEFSPFEEEWVREE